MKKFVYIYLILILLSFTTYSQQKDDLLGWQESRWGMTEKQLLETFKDKIQKFPERRNFSKWYADYGILDYEIDGKKYQVSLQMGKDTNKLEQVLVYYTEDRSKTPFTVEFESLDALFTRKYGIAGYKKDVKNEVYYSLQRQWVLPTTTIKLNHLWSSDNNFSPLTIIYFPTSKELDKI